MKPISPKKLRHSKWTAVELVGKAKHFLVIDLEHDDDGVLERCLLEAVVTRKAQWLPWRELNDRSVWLQGWQ